MLEIVLHQAASECLAARGMMRFAILVAHGGGAEAAAVEAAIAIAPQWHIATHSSALFSTL